MNPLNKEIETFLDNIAGTESLLYQTESHFRQHLLQLPVNLKGSDDDDPIISTSLVISDITGPTDNGWFYHYPTGFDRVIKYNELEPSIRKLISQIGMRSMSTCYEILESLIFDLASKYLFKFNSTINNQVKLGTNGLSVEEIRTELKRKYNSKNNRKMIGLIKSFSSDFQFSDTKNNYNRNLTDWYEVLSRVRHGITHSLFRIKKNEAYSSESQKSIFQDFFNHNSKSNILLLDMPLQQSKAQIKMIAEYGFLIFKSLSLSANQEWQIFKNMK